MLPNFWFDPEVINRYGAGVIRFNQMSLVDIKTVKGVSEDLQALHDAGLSK